MRCVKTLTDSTIPEAIRSTLLGNLSEDFFHYPPCIAAHHRIATIAKKRFELMDFEDLVEDPSLDEDFRDILRTSEDDSCKSKRAITKLLDRLLEYRRIRIIYNLANNALDELDSQSLDVEALIETITNEVVLARRTSDETQNIIHIGDGDNSSADDVVNDVIYNMIDVMTKTGFTEYDAKNGGLPEEGVMIIAATTSGGKSALLLNLLINLYQISKKKVLRVSLEMGDKQETSRFLSCLSEVPFYKIKQNKTSPKEKQRMKRAYEKFKSFGKKNKCRFSTVSPTKGMTIDEIFRMVKPFQDDVVAIDYISLLEGVDDDNQWMKLSAIARDAKVFSRDNKCLVILLCQLDDESNKLRYSRGLKEHADVLWQWNYSTEAQRELRVLPVHAAKVRDGEVFQFPLGERFDVMKVENMSSDTGDASDEGVDVDIDDDDDDDAGSTGNNYALE